jgi:hypothetical protein
MANMSVRGTVDSSGIREISVRALAAEPDDKSGCEMNSEIPLCAAPPCTFTEAKRPREVKASFKVGRDSEWPLAVTLASSLHGENSISVTYPIELSGSYPNPMKQQ